MSPSTIAELETWATAHAPQGSVQARQVLELIDDYLKLYAMVYGLAERCLTQSQLLGIAAEKTGMMNHKNCSRCNAGMPAHRVNNLCEECFAEEGDGFDAESQGDDSGPEPMAVASHGPQAPKTHDEARFFHDGFLAGVTAYAGAVGHSQLKSDNPKLRELFDAQGWQTIETFERLSEAVLVCEHSVKDGDWCEPCNKEMKASELGQRCEENTMRILDEARKRAEKPA